LLVEVGSCSKYVPLEKILSEVMEWGIDKGLIEDGALAMTNSQRKNFWKFREELPEGQRRLGPQLKQDLSVPPGVLAEFLDLAATECNKILPGVRINSFGHLGDGNVHFNLSPPIDKSDFNNLDEELSSMLADLVSDMRGSFAAEHGIGRMKIDLANKLRCKIERNLMLNIKGAFDKTNQLNPGVVVSKKFHSCE
jgi:FAD/FMN-containing dehydrogenase